MIDNEKIEAELFEDEEPSHTIIINNEVKNIELTVTPESFKKLTNLFDIELELDEALSKLKAKFKQEVYVEIVATKPLFLKYVLTNPEFEDIFLNYCDFYFFPIFEIVNHYEEVKNNLQKVWQSSNEELKTYTIKEFGLTTAILLWTQNSHQESEDDYGFASLMENIHSWNIYLNMINYKNTSIVRLFNQQPLNQFLETIQTKYKDKNSFFFIEKNSKTKDWDFIWEFINKEVGNHSFLIVSNETLNFQEENEEKFSHLNLNNQYFIYWNYETQSEKIPKE